MNPEDYNFLSEIAWFALCFRLKAEQAGRVPRFLGPVFHGAFGHALAEVGRIMPDAAPLLQLCYPERSSADHRPQSGAVCRPFLFSVKRNAGGQVAPDQTVEATFVCQPILATQSAYLPGLQFAVQCMAQRGLGPDQVPFSVERITFHPQPIFVPAYPDIDVQPLLYTGKEWLEHSAPPPESCEVVLETPTQLVSKDCVLRTMDGPIFFRRLWQRMAAWGNLELGSQIKPPFFDSIRVEADETQWWMVERWSSRQEKRIDVSGLVGKVVFSGLDVLAWRLLILGEHLHVGKNTTCALGKYRIV